MRRILSTAAAMGVFASSVLLPSSYALDAMPVLDYADKNVNVTQPNAANMNIQINGGQYAVGEAHWKSFNIGQGGNVNVEFTAGNQTSLNYVDAAGGMSYIYGNFTNSGCANCFAQETGKVILVNPNGILFGSSANVDLNSFTATTMDVKGYNNNYGSNGISGVLNLQKNNTNGNIYVYNGAKIHGDKGVTLASDDNMYLYQGSQISTNIDQLNTDRAHAQVTKFDTIEGKVKLVTSDGVNFTYKNSGAIDKVDITDASTKAMTLSVEGSINAGHIDIRNTSTNTNSLINIKGATLKATKANTANVGADGNIWLTAGNKIATEGSTFTTTKLSNATLGTNEGMVRLKGNNGVSSLNDTITAVGNVDLLATNTNATVATEGTTIKSDLNVTVSSTAGTASVNKATKTNGVGVQGKNITISGAKAQITNSTANATNDITISSTGSGGSIANSSTLTAGNNINYEATGGAVQSKSSTNTATNNINVTSLNNIATENFTSSKFNAKYVNLNSTGTAASNANVGNIYLKNTTTFTPTEKLNLTSAKDTQISQDAALTVSKTNISAGGDVLLKSNKNNLTVANSTTFAKANTIHLNGTNVTTSGTVDMNNLKTDIVASNNIDVTLSNVGNSEKGITASAGNNMKITTPGTLSVSSLISKGDMTLDATSIIKGKDYMADPTLGGFTKDTTSSRSYIEVGGTFTSKPNFTITESKELLKDETDGKFYNHRHHIQYGNETIYLVNKRPDTTAEPTLPTINIPTANLASGATIVNTDTSSSGVKVNPDGGLTPKEYTGGGQGGQGGQGGGGTGVIECTGDPARADSKNNEELP